MAYSDVYVQMKVAELMREVENDRLADLAAKPGRPMRARIAEWLVAIAERIDNQPQGSIAHAEA
ncbi:MAG: hypothetical protein JO318_13970 [Chloroflexi bacterium]|nr:hypothetical protein [Chloroflexota bacterium]MBV9133805.1 hypothetical protein [Chloroflexota bacterium]